MNQDARPVVVAFDGSPESQAAVQHAVALFGGREIVIVSVWEPGIAMAWETVPDATGVTYAVPSPEEIEMIDRLERDHAAVVAEAGVQLATDLGAHARAEPVPDEADVAETVTSIADQEDAAAIVVGSRGLGAVKSRLLGSTSRRLVHESRRPVLVVRAPQ